MSELRWHRLLREWVVVTSHRQDRPQMPRDWCPFCPGSGRVPEQYDVYLYPNDFPAFALDDPAAPGACDVVLYSPEHTLLPSALPISQWEKIVALWTRRYVELRALDPVKYISIFENTGEAVGVTMPHPHGQIYALPFVPPRVAREWAAASEHQMNERECLHCRVLQDEQREATRIIASNPSFIAFAPAFARFPYEVHLSLRRHAAEIDELTPAEQHDLAGMISALRGKYDSLFSQPMPLMMSLQQRIHFYVEFLPLQRAEGKLKYLASVESSLNTFLNDVAPEVAAEALRALP